VTCVAEDRTVSNQVGVLELDRRVDEHVADGTVHPRNQKIEIERDVRIRARFEILRTRRR
jgi:hypothetical protein